MQHNNIDELINERITDFIPADMLKQLEKIKKNLDKVDGSVVSLAAGSDISSLMFPASEYVNIDTSYFFGPEKANNQIDNHKNQADDFDENINELFRNNYTNLTFSLSETNDKKIFGIYSINGSPKKIFLYNEDINDAEAVKQILEKHSPVKLLILKGIAKPYDLEPFKDYVAKGGYIIEADRTLEQSHKHFPEFKHKKVKNIFQIELPIRDDVYYVDGYISRKK